MDRVSILNKIKSLQVKDDSSCFNNGLFPSYRKNTVLGISRPDDNIFFSASVLFILKSLGKHITQQEKKVIESIEKELLPNYRFYTNKPERHSYNFWQKKPYKHFPNGFILHRFSKFKLPDDIDSTALVHMTYPLPKNKALLTKEALIQHVNGTKLLISNGHKELRQYKAYSTWFGEKMPIEFDVCVLCNYLLWHNKFDFELNTHDKASIQLIKHTIQKSLYFECSFKSAPEYPKIEVILYHLARLASETMYLEDLKPKIIQDIQYALTLKLDTFDTMILKSSLLKLGTNDFINSTEPVSVNQLKNKWWFTAGLLSVYSYPIVKQIAPFSAFHFRFSCEAFNYALLFENMVLQ